MSIDGKRSTSITRFEALIILIVYGNPLSHFTAAPWRFGRIWSRFFIAQRFSRLHCFEACFSLFSYLSSTIWVQTTMLLQFFPRNLFFLVCITIIFSFFFNPFILFKESEESKKNLFYLFRSDANCFKIIKKNPLLRCLKSTKVSNTPIVVYRFPVLLFSL